MRPALAATLLLCAAAPLAAPTLPAGQATPVLPAGQATPVLPAGQATPVLPAGQATPVLPAGQATPIASPYDTQADAHAAVAAAFTAAKASGHKVILDFGGNWCPDCRMLAGVLELPQVKAWTAQHFETVYIDVGRYTKNTDLAEHYGVKLHAAPTVLIVTPDGHVLNGQYATALADARSMSAQAVVDLLASWAGQ